MPGAQLMSFWFGLVLSILCGVKAGLILCRAHAERQQRQAHCVGQAPRADDQAQGRDAGW